MKKATSFLLAIVLLLVFIPMGAITVAADAVWSDYYGRAALEALPNGAALVYAYDELVTGIGNATSPIRFSDNRHSITPDELKMVVDTYRRDYSQTFWMGNQYSYYIRGESVTQMMPQYTLSGTALEFAKSEMEEAADKLLAGIDNTMSEFEIELYLHDALAQQVVYIDSENAHNAYGALVEGEAVCEGYAHAMQYLLHRAGIQSYIAHGSSVNPGTGIPEGHAWNYVRIDGNYYHLDLTWDDQDSYTYHAYFNVSDAQIQQDHEVEGAAYALPLCESEAANYFRVMGGYMDEYTVDEVAELLKKNHLSVSLYVPDGPTAFYAWFKTNIKTIAKKVGVVGSFSYGYMCLGNEVVPYILGQVPEEPEEPQEPAKNGWVKEDGKWTYYQNDIKATNKWLKDNGKWYFLDANGYMVTNAWKKDSKGWVYVGKDGAMLTNAWCKDSKGWCYVGADGYAVTNCWKKDSKGWIWLDKNGSTTKSKWIQDGGKWYYLDANGYMVAGKTVTIGGEKYTFNAKGEWVK